MSMLRTVRSGLRHLTLGWAVALSAILGLLVPMSAFANELDLKLPTLDPHQRLLLMGGIGVCLLGMAFGLVMFLQVKNMPVALTCGSSSTCCGVRPVRVFSRTDCWA